MVVKSELQEGGFYSYLQNKKTGEEWEQFVPFEHMQEVLIARTTRYQSRGANTLGYYIVGAKIIMKWMNENGEPNYSLFGLENQNNLDEWIQRFKENDIPVYSSGSNVSALQLEDYQTAYEELPKMPYDNDASSPRIGTIQYRNLKTWRSSEMKEKKRLKEIKHDKRVLNPLLLAMLLGNFLIAISWMPSWQVDDGMFGENSPSFIVNSINFMLLLIVGAYWRAKVKWYRSLRDVGFILFAQLIGWILLRLSGPVTTGMLDAIIVDGIVLALFNGIIFIVFRLIRKIR